MTEDAPINIAVPNITIRAVDRHEGTTTLIVPPTYRLEWKSQQGTELTQQLSVGTIQEQLQYVFSFTRQPQGLTVSFRREVNVAEVRPTYLAEIDRGRVKLTGWLKCTFDRSLPAEIGVQLDDWNVVAAEAISDPSTPFAPGEMLSQQKLSDGVLKLSHDVDSELIVARRYQQLWRIVAYRSIGDAAIQPLKISIPNLLLLPADSSRVPIENLTGVLMVSTSNSVSVTWDEQNSQSLLNDALPGEWTTLLDPTLADRTVAYRYQSDSNSAPLWAGRVEVLPQRIAVEQTGQAKIDADMVRLTQRFQLQIANEPLAQLRLVVDSQPRDLSVMVGEIPCIVEASPVNPSAPNGPQVLNVVGAPKLLGRINVEVRSQVPIPASLFDNANQSDANESRSVHEAQVKVPLVRLDLPDAVTRTAPLMQFQMNRQFNVSISTNVDSTLDSELAPEDTEENWKQVTTVPIELRADQTDLDLLIRRLDEIDPTPVRVSRAWLQTALTGASRSDRFCARFQSQQDTLTIVLPAFELMPQIAIDGVQQNFSPDQGRVQIDLRDLPQRSEHTLEVWTRSASTLTWLNKIEVTPVRIEGCRKFDYFYWQLVTPANEHLVAIPQAVTAEWRWTWDRLWWKRQSPQDEAYFEQWVSASAQQPLAESANRYVVSAFGTLPVFEVKVASRLLLWLPVGLFAIGLALLISVWRAARHPVTILLVAAGVLVVAAVWPDLSIMLGQTALIALSVVMLYALTQAAIESRIRRRSVFTTRPSSIMVETSDQHSLVRAGSHASSEVVATTRTQAPIVHDGGGH